MNLKTTFYVLGVILLSTLTSCLGSSDDSAYIVSPDAEISSFSIKGNKVFPGENKNDTIKNGLDSIVFSIDQVRGLIYNRDSAQYGLIFPDSVLVKYTTVSGYNIFNITGGDSTAIRSEKDSINLFKPLKIRSYAANGDKKEYTLQFNIRKVDPEVIIWKRVNNNLDFLDFNETKTVMFNDKFYCFTKYAIPPVSGYPYLIALHISSDMAMNWGNPVAVNLPEETILSQIQSFGEDLFVCTSTGDLYTANINDNFTTWTKVTSAYPVKNVFGTVNKVNKLALAVEKEGSIVSAVYTGNDWQYGNTLSPLFPNQEFSSISYERVRVGHLTVTGGTSRTSWGTTDGLYWAPMRSPLPLNMQGTSTFLYDNKFYLLNGVVENNYSASVYTSIDEANTWQISTSKALPGSYKSRTGASVVVSSNNTIYIIGGKNNGNPVTDIWKGKLNRLN